MTRALALDAPSESLAEKLVAAGLAAILQPLRLLMANPSLLFLAALTTMLLRAPEVSFYAVDRIAFCLLVLAITMRAMVFREPLLRIERATFPMLALTALAVTSIVAGPFDNQTWSLVAAKFIVPFTLFHLAGAVFTSERSLRKFEMFALVVLVHLSFTAIAFLAGANSVIFPRFILDPSLGTHADRARGPFLQAVANGVSINMLALLALHAFSRRVLHGWRAAVLLAAVPLAILATMTRAVWLTFMGTVFVLALRSSNRTVRRACLGLVGAGLAGLLIILSSPEWRSALSDRLEERGPVEFRGALYSGAWQMFLERPFTGWGVNAMPSGLARHVSEFHEKELYPHNTYLELLVEHGILGFALYAWMMFELWRLGRNRLVTKCDPDGLLNQHFRSLWPVFLGVYLVNASLVVMNYQFVNGLLFTIAGMLAAQNRAARSSLAHGNFAS